MGSTEADDAHLGSTDHLRRQQKRTSGGFLLESPSRPTRLARSLLTKPLRDRKAKRSDNGDDITPVKRLSLGTPGQPKGITEAAISKPGGHFDQVQIHATDTSSSLTGSKISSERQNGALVGGGSASRPASVGLDTDPAQIVDMALKLSEGRRRQISEKRYSANDTTGFALRQDTTPNRIPAGNPPYSSPGHFVGTRSSSQNPVSPATGQRESSLSQVGAASVSRTEDMDTGDTLEISKATAARVQKARTYLELAYEHRRILAHLPPIRRPDTQSRQGKDFAESKIYNPLQYARNRRLRLREKVPIMAEAEGWHDVDRVRKWVDAAINSHPETQHDPAECVRLPPLREDGESQNNDIQGISHQNKVPQRPRRPKSDWITHPGDLLADSYWLEQGMNKIKIQDRDNKPIYPPDTHFKYAGWRDRVTPAKIPQSTPESKSPAGSTLSPKVKISPVAAAPELPQFRSAHHNNRDNRHIRGRTKLKRAFAEDAKGSKRKALELFEHNSNSSTSSESDTDARDRTRGRSRFVPKLTTKLNIPDGDPLDSPVESSRVARESTGLSTASDFSLSAQSLTRRSADEHPIVKFWKKTHTPRGSISDVDRPRRKLASPDDRSNQRSSGEYDTASPASPFTYSMPSIAINLSPPHSRSPSPTKKRGSTILHPMRVKHRHKDHDSTATNNVAGSESKSHSRDPSTDRDKSHHGSDSESRGTSPMTKARRGSSFYEESSINRPAHRGSTMSRMSTKSATPTEQSSRIRGMFKGGRIAEIVGHEVSKVGGFIWKRDPPSSSRNTASISEGSTQSDHTSDTDDEVVNRKIYKTPPKKFRRSMSSSSSHSQTQKPQEGATEEQKYYNPNLPSFTSPFQRDRERQEKKREPSVHGSPKPNPGDHISLQVVQHRSRSKSPRFDRLAPPKLDTSGKSKPPSRRNSYEGGAPLDLTNSRSASQAFNNAIGRAPFLKNGGEAGNDMETSDVLHPGLPIISTQTDSPQVTQKDLQRVTVVLLMSSVKAKVITASSPGLYTDQVLDSTLVVNRSQDARLRHCEDHIVAARNLVSKVSGCNDIFKDKLSGFSQDMVANLHNELQILEDTIENTLTPRVRNAADDAGELGTKLTTTSTLAVKSLNERISEGFRLRRRGPFRFLNTIAYGAIEWGVVGLLWIIWAIVTIIRIVLGTVRGCVKLTRWLLWID